MTLKEARDCLQNSPELKCEDCKYNHTDIDCRAIAMGIGADAIGYLIIADTLTKNLEERDG